MSEKNIVRILADVIKETHCHEIHFCISSDKNTNVCYELSRLEIFLSP